MALQLTRDALITSIEAASGFSVATVATGDLTRMAAVAIEGNLLPKGGVFANAVAQDDILVASDSNQVEGFIYLLKCADAKFGWYVKKIASSKAVRGKGVGSLLFLAAFKSISTADPNLPVTLVVQKTNVKAAGLYQRIGFLKAGQYPQDFPSSESDIENSERSQFDFYKISDGGKGYRNTKQTMKINVKGTLAANTGTEKRRTLSVPINYQGCKTAELVFRAGLVTHAYNKQAIKNKEAQLTGFKAASVKATDKKITVRCVLSKFL